MEKKSIKGTQTEHNLLASFAGESQARSRYTLFAEKAREEGYEQIAAVFMETAEQELSHARQFFALLEGGTVQISAGTPPELLVTPRPTLPKQPQANARSGATSMKISQRPPRTKVFRKLPICTNSLPKSK